MKSVLLKSTKFHMFVHVTRFYADLTRHTHTKYVLGTALSDAAGFFAAIA